MAQPFTYRSPDIPLSVPEGIRPSSETGQPNRENRPGGGPRGGKVHLWDMRSDTSMSAAAMLVQTGFAN